MAYNVLIKNDVAATDVRSFNRSAQYTSGSLANGYVFYLDSLVAGTTGCEIWNVTASTGSAGGYWMAGSEDVNLLTSGTYKYRGLDVDPQNFNISTCTVFDAFKPQVGDILTMTAEGFSGAVSSNTYANAADNRFDLVWGSTKAGSALSLKLLDTTYISKADGTLGDDQRVTAYKLQVIANPSVD